MLEVVFYKDKRGKEPVREWMADPDNSTILPGIDARITALREYGIQLLDTKMMLPIKPRGKKERKISGFYELRYVSQGWRIAVYHDIKRNRFVLLHGFRKKKQLEKGEIDKAYTLVYEYIDKEKEAVNVQISDRRYN
ncbi:MAG: type II toxin-antitoxin system RelE/ParE family toxin [Chloroflexi bacterium]|nr:type II toxin-antitoxin system RelE/ParE family toxin [Chloroflexota bacterium]